MVAGNIVHGSADDEQFSALAPVLNAHNDNNFYSLQGFHAVQQISLGKTLLQGTRNLMLGSGLGKLRSNFLAMGFREKWEDVDLQQVLSTYDYVDCMRDAFRLNYGVGILRGYEHKRFGRELYVTADINELGNRTLRDKAYDKMVNASRTRNIDVFWLDDSGGMTLLLPHILRKKKEWRFCRIRVILFRDKNMDEKEQIEKTKLLLHSLRIAVSEVICVNLDFVQATLNTRDTTEIKRVGKVVNEIESVWQSAQDSIEGSKEGDGKSDSSPGKHKRDDEMAALRRLKTSAIIGRSIAEVSEDPELVVVSMSFPSSSISAALFMAMLNLISSPVKRPVLFVRGTQKRVLSMDS